MIPAPSGARRSKGRGRLAFVSPIGPPADPQDDVDAPRGVRGELLLLLFYGFLVVAGLGVAVVVLSLALLVSTRGVLGGRAAAMGAAAMALGGAAAWASWRFLRPRDRAFLADPRTHGLGPGGLARSLNRAMSGSRRADLLSDPAVTHVLRPGSRPGSVRLERIGLGTEPPAARAALLVAGLLCLGGTLWLAWSRPRGEAASRIEQALGCAAALALAPWAIAARRARGLRRLPNAGRP
jgi:hypothetical protein